MSNSKHLFMKNLENVKKMMLQCVVINWDGTLVSSSHMIHEAYLRTMRALQLQKKWSFEDTLRQSGRPPVEIFSDPSIWGKKQIGAIAKEFFYKRLEDIRKENPELLQLKKGAIELIDWFAQHPSHPRIVICGNKTQAILEKEVKTFKLDKVHSVVGSSFDSVANKPHREMFSRAVAGLNIKDRKEEVIHIGDNPLVDPPFAGIYGASSILIAEIRAADAASIPELLEKLNS